jgi:hypothetical protein
MISVLTTQIYFYSTKTSVYVIEHGGVEIIFYLWTLEFEIHIMFMCCDVSFFIFFLNN